MLSFLELVDQQWIDHCEHMLVIRNIFLYLDQSFVLNSPGRKSIWEMGVALFRERLEFKQDLEKKLLSGILSTINAERDGQAVDTQLLHRLIGMLSSMGSYKDKFETPFLQESRRFFREEGLQLVGATDAAVYLQHVEHRLAQAMAMVTHYLDNFSQYPLICVIEETLLVPHMAVLISRGAGASFEHFRLEDLNRLYVMAGRVDGLGLLKEAWAGYIRSVGQAYLNTTVEALSDRDTMSQLLVFQDKVDAILKQAFCNNDEFRICLKLSFEHVINIKQGYMAELIARYVDRKLRGEKGVTDFEVENNLEKVIKIFQHLQGKDVFEAFYKKLLAKRLLLGKSSNFDNESMMLSKLKAECGVEFTAKLEGMFTDIGLSKDTMVAYAEHRRAAHTERCPPSPEVDTEIQILTTGFWPTYPKLAVNLPLELARQRDQFAVFYNEKYQGRRLAWIHAADRCIVSARFPKCKKEFELSLLQTRVLLCFNRTARLSFLDIKSESGVNDDELRRVLQSLACGKIGTRVLVKEPKGRDVMDIDAFTVDLGFTNKQFRIKINTIQMKETAEEIEKTHEEVFRERQYQVDAILVRQMKARKTLSHNELMSGTLSQLRFTARAADVKQRIESLIERDFMQRDPDVNSCYNYVA
jgi:cullin 4